MAESKNLEHVAPAAVAALVTGTVAAALVLIRGEVDNSVVALALAAVVAACGLLGGWRAGVASAVAAAVSFNFFHTQPYLSLRIHDADDVLTTLTLLAVGLMAGASAHVAERRGVAGRDAGEALLAVERVVRVVASGDADDAKRAVLDELGGVLTLDGCEFVAEPPPGLVELTSAGTTDERVLVYRRGGFELPTPGVDIPVHARGATVGHLVCRPSAGTGVSLTRRRAAVALAELLGVAQTIGRSTSTPSPN